MNDIQLLNQYVEQCFPKFGVNKSNEIARLLYEISKRDHCAYNKILSDEMCDSSNFLLVKTYLLECRYPHLTKKERSIIPSLGELKSSIDDIASTQESLCIKPKKIFCEKSMLDCDLTHKFRHKFPDAEFHEIGLYRDYVNKKSFALKNYNARRDDFFIIEEKYDFYLHCPCSKPSQPCGYHIMNSGIGCGFDCVYCYLQGYINAPGIVFPGNLDAILNEFAQYYRPGMRVGTGQFTDSLMYDSITAFSPQMIEFFRGYPDVTFEFKTKSNHIDLIRQTPVAANVVISWSLNPQNIIDECELYTASLDQRIEAARMCVEAGYHVGFHFDPIIYDEGWEDAYQAIIDQIFTTIPANRIAWISLGCLRMTLKLRQTMEARFPNSSLLDAEQIIGFDGKLRYPRRIRCDIYTAMIKHMRTYAQDISVYLCMEDKQMNDLFGIQSFACQS